MVNCSVVAFNILKVLGRRLENKVALSILHKSTTATVLDMI